MKGATILFVVLALSVFAVAAEDTLEDRAAKYIQKYANVEEDSSDYDSDSSSYVPVKKPASILDGKVADGRPKDAVQKKARKYIQKEGIKAAYRKENGGDDSISNDDHIKSALDKLIAARTQTMMENYIVRVPVKTMAGGKAGRSMVDAKLSAVVESSKAKFPTTYCTSTEGDIVPVNTKQMGAIARRHTKDIRRSAERTVISELMQRAQKDPLAEEAMIELMFSRIVKQHPRIAEQKAFAKIEKEMNLKTGALYNQYRSGIEMPSVSDPALQAKASTKKSAANAAVAGVYSTLNTMDLNTEQDIPEGVRSLLNSQLRKADKKKEEEKTKKNSVATFLFGKL